MTSLSGKALIPAPVNSSLTNLGIFWAILSLTSAVLSGVGFYLPFWIQGEIFNRTTVYFGSFRRCNYPRLLENGKYVELCLRCCYLLLINQSETIELSRPMPVTRLWILKKTFRVVCSTPTLGAMQRADACGRKPQLGKAKSPGVRASHAVLQPYLVNACVF